MTTATHYAASEWVPVERVFDREIFSIDGVMLLSAPINNKFRQGHDTLMREINRDERDHLLNSGCGLPYEREDEIPSEMDLAISMRRILKREPSSATVDRCHSVIVARFARYVEGPLPTGTYLVRK